jgi:hypothetical protein
VAKLTGTAITSDLKGLREDLSDLISNIAPTETPFFQRAGKGTADAVFHEWQQDDLAAASSTNAQPEGNNFTSFDAIVPTVRVGNYCQIFEKTISVSGTIEAVKKAGRAREMALQTVKKMKEIKRDFEKNCLENIAAVNTDPRKMGTMGAWIKTNTVKGAGGGDPSYTTFPNAARTDGTQVAFTVTMLKTAVGQAWDQGGEPDVLLVGKANKQLASGFAGIATNTYNVETPQRNQKNIAIQGAAGVYVHDFGVLEVIPDRFQRTRDAWVLDMSLISIDYLRSLKTKPLAETGDATNKLLYAELTLRVINEKGLTLIADLL